MPRDGPSLKETLTTKRRCPVNGQGGSCSRGVTVVAMFPYDRQAPFSDTVPQAGRRDAALINPTVSEVIATQV